MNLLEPQPLMGSNRRRGDFPRFRIMSVHARGGKRFAVAPWPHTGPCLFLCLCVLVCI